MSAEIREDGPPRIHMLGRVDEFIDALLDW